MFHFHQNMTALNTCIIHFIVLPLTIHLQTNKLHTKILKHETTQHIYKIMLITIQPLTAAILIQYP